MTLFQRILAVSSIIFQLWLPALGNASWDRRRSESGVDNRVYPPPPPEHSFWSSWAEWQPCSRTCGGGISSRIRYCQPRLRSRPEHCPGEPKQFRLCSTQLCAKEEQDFRQRQCASYNNKITAGEFHKRWTPVQGHHGCDLKCRSLDHGIVYTFGKVNDSTPCHKNGEHICLNGRCMEIGCDLLLGSTRRLDACGVCGGRNESCAQVRGTYVVGTNYGRRKGAEKGYEEVTLIPAESTRVYVSDTSEQNYLALADSRHRILVNRDRQVSWPGNYPVAGTSLNYSRQWNLETFNILGPTKEDLYLMLLVYDRNAAPVNYEYWTLPGFASKGHRPVPNRPPAAPTRPAPTERPSHPKNGGKDRRTDPRPEPREGPGRDPEDYKRYGDPYAHRDPRRPDQTPASRNPGPPPGPGTDSRHHNQSQSNNRNPGHHPSSANDPRQPSQPPGGRQDVPRPSSANDPRYNPNPTSRNDARSGEDSRRTREHTDYGKPDNRIPDGGQIQPGKTNKGRCPPCRRVNEKVKNFCDSEFVVRAKVINVETVGSETRYDLGIVESYKNTVYTSHREYVWSPTVEGAPGTRCRCPRLRRNQDYILMGHFDRHYRKRESRLLITSRSYVRKANSKRDIEMKNLKKMAARKCKKE